MTNNDENNTNIFKNFEVNLDHFKLSNESAKKLDEGKFIYLFGKNGSGKTELSRYIKKYLAKECDVFVFNKDYIAENIFVEDTENNENDLFKSKIKQKTNNKSNSWKIFLGNESIFINQSLKYIDKLIDDLKFQLNNNEYQNYFLNKLYGTNKEEYIKIYSIDEVREIIKQEIKINNSKFTETKKNFLKELKIFEKNIKKENFYELYSKLLKLGNEIISKNKEPKKENKIEKNKKSYKNIEFHKAAIKYQEENSIEFLGVTYSIEKVKEYINIWSQDIHELFSDLNKIYEKIKEDYSYNELTNNEKNKIDCFIKSIEFLDISKFETLKLKILDLNEIDKSFSNWLNKNKLYFWKSKLNFNEINIKLEEINEAIDKINTKFNFNNEKKFNFSLLKVTISNNLQDFLIQWNNIETIRKRLHDLLKNFGNHKKEIITKKFEKNLNILTGCKNTIKLKSSRTGNESLISISINSKDINYISEGEKSSFAFAYFLTDLEFNLENVKKNFIVYIDDPFDSNDHYKYLNFNNINISDKCLSEFIQDVEKKQNENIIQNLKKSNQKYNTEFKKIESKIIVSTHNMNFLSSFLINLCNSKKYIFNKIEDEQLAKKIVLKKIIKREKSLINIESVDINLLFSFEKKLKSFFEKFCNYYEKIIIDLKKEQQKIFKLISCILIKMNDFYDSNKRMQYKHYFKEFSRKGENQKANVQIFAAYVDTKSLNLEENFKNILDNFDSYKKNKKFKWLILCFNMINDIDIIEKDILLKHIRNINVDFNTVEKSEINNIIKEFNKKLEDNKLCDADIEDIINFLNLIKKPYQEIILSKKSQRHKIITHKLFYNSHLIHFLED